METEEDYENEIWEEFWNSFAQAFTHPLKNNALLGNFITNPDVTGAYAEAWIKSLVISRCPQFRVSTGAVIRSMDQTRDLKTIPQCDLIIGDSSELTALFEQGDFALVPIFSVRAIIEVKRTCSDIPKLEEQLKVRQKCLMPRFQNNVLGIVVSHPKPLFDGQLKPDWLKDRKWREKPAIIRLLSDDSQETDVDGVFAFIYFLSQLAGHGYLARKDTLDHSS
jgi:hypothetical protein